MRRNPWMITGLLSLLPLYDSVCTPGAATSLPELDKLFKNATSWMLAVE